LTNLNCTLKIRKRLRIDSYIHCEGAHLFWHFEPPRFEPSIQTKSAGRPAL